jgi:DNA-binding PadR family transcriptional regulator
MPRSRLGELEEQVLLALVRLGGESYAAQVAAELSERTRRDVSPATTFMVMRRLEQHGFLTSRIEDAELEADPSWRGRPRRVYAVKMKAVVPLLREARRARLALWDGIEGLIK